MENVYKDKLIFVTHIIYVVLLVMAVTIALTSYCNAPHIRYESFTDFDSGWYYEETGESFSDFGRIFEPVTISKNLTEADNYKSMFMRVRNLNIDVYLDGVLDKSYGKDIVENAYYKSYGTYFPMIFLNDAAKVTIDISTPYEHDTSCNIKQIYIGEPDGIVKYQISKLLMGFCVSLLSILLGIIFCIFAIALRKYGSQALSLFSIGLFSIIFGAWSGLEVQLLQLLIDNPAPMHVAIHMNLMLVVMPLFMFYRQRGETKDKVGSTLIIITTSLTFIINTILHYCNIMDFHETIAFTHVTILLGTLFTLKYGYTIFKKSRGKDVAFWGLSIIGVCCLIDVICYYTQITTDSSAFIKIGVLGYLTALGIDIVSKYAKTYKANLRAKMLEQMAYEDIMTGCYNHNKFISDLKIMNKNIADYKGKCIMIFDMNCLKYINDTYGHNMGDAALCESAGIIKDIFGDMGKCYRTGGDEFAVVTDVKVSNDTIDGLYDKFNAKIVSRNESAHDDRPYPLYIAFGYDIIDADAHETVHSADKRMYENKIAIKEKLLIINPDLIRT